MKLKSILIGAVASVLAMSAGTSMAADYGKQDPLLVIGTWNFLNHWKEREGPFWTDRVPEATGGALTANAKSITELGRTGFEVMRMLEKGAADVVFAVATYVSQDSPELEGADLPGLVTDLAQYREVIESYRSIMEREVNDKYNSKLMVIYAWPSQELWCNLGDKGKKEVMLSELEGKKIRVYSTPLGDFVEGIGGSSVTIPFGEVIPALQRGVADCGITGTLPAYNAKWWQVVTHNIQVRLGYAASFMAINNDTWNGLTPDAQALLLEETAKLEEEFWVATAAMEDVATRCNFEGPCEIGETGNMVPVVPSGEDQARVRQIFNDVVGARWAKRCGTQKCVDEWNDSIGKVVGVELSL